MKSILLISIFLIYSIGYCQEDISFEPIVYDNPQDLVYSDIEFAEINLRIPFTETSWNHYDNIICLSRIYPKRMDHQYSGLSFKVTLDDIAKWKLWFNENKNSIRYFIGPENFQYYRIPIIELKNKEIRIASCFYPQN
ncbi:hypothetical protein [Flavobacterium sp.]|uniref:hypothetical protein n=1 Tax=Flavobacterium sp. TaxID=239 RepID=UPI0039E45308